MVYGIVWTSAAIESYISNIQYLEEAWSEKEVSRFKLLTEKKIRLLSAHPKLGAGRDKKNENIRFTLLNKRVALIYRIQKNKKEIELLWFWNTRMNPPV